MFAASLISAWVWGSTLRAVEEALGDATGPVAVVGGAPLAKLLAKKRTVVTATTDLTGLVAVASATAPHIAEWSTSLRDGGTLVVLDRAPREATTKLLLCSGLVDIEQRNAGRWTITSGKLRRL